MFSRRTKAHRLIGCVFQLIAAITSHFGETLVRLRFTEYVSRFVRLASRYEEVATGSTALGFPTVPFSEGSLGSGVVFPDETLFTKELSTNASRIEGWRRTKTYQYCTTVRTMCIYLDDVLQSDRTFKNIAPRTRSKGSISCISFRVFALRKIFLMLRLS